jgi:uncharacterized OsmC-like protein
MKFTILENKVLGDLEFGTISISPQPENGFRPLELMLSSLSGCSGSLLRTLLQKKRINYSSLTIDASATRNPEKANRIEKITLKASVTAENGLNVEQGKKLAELVISNCGMIQSVINSIEIEFIIHFNAQNGASS